jgi:hypothetical protein
MEDALDDPAADFQPQISQSTQIKAKPATDLHASRG